MGSAGILALVALLTACGALPSTSKVPTPSSSPPTDAKSYAHYVLAEAVIPPGARSTRTFDSDLLKQPSQSPAIDGLFDAHELYVIDELPNVVEGFLKTHLPSGGTLSGTGTFGGPQGSEDEIVVSMPPSGSNENFAELLYAVVADGANGSELRVDAQVVWMPNRSADELAPPNAIVEVTGFSTTSLANESSGPVTVEVSQAQANALETVVNSLPLAPPPSCAEDSLLYKIVFRPTKDSSESFELDGYGCAATVLVFKNGNAMSPLNDRGCSLMHAVVDLLPTGEASGTRDALGDCVR